MLPINKPSLGAEELETVRKVIESGVLTNSSPEGGPNVRAFEKGLAEYLSVRHVVAVNSGTAAIQIALFALGVGPGEEVIVPSFTFAATAGAVVLAGAKPVFVDVDLDTYNMMPEAFKKVITKKTKAVVPVDLYGLPAEMDEIKEIAKEHEVKVIEDACQALGSSYKGRMAGTLGDIGCFSFYPGKVMTTGEGGAIITDDDALAEKLRRTRTHGQVKGNDSVMLGGNFRMPEIEAAIGRVQLKKLPSFLAARAKNAASLRDKLDGVGVVLPEVPRYSTHNWYLFTVRFETAKARERVRSRLLEGGMGATVYYPTPVHRLPFYAGLGYGELKLPASEKAAETVLSLPVNPDVREEDLDRMAEIIKKTKTREET
jgi:dTDP-4-amino-4,6-dideoxygalactose transaminase